MDLPDPYWASAALVQPVWQLRTRLGSERALDQLLMAQRDFPQFTTYTSFAAHIVETSDSDAKLFLEDAYAVRGLLNLRR